jgi:NADP-dependent 3-hydroxy acid dehydrogenase YdfG
MPKACLVFLTGRPGIGAMFAKALDVNGAAKVYILGRRLDKLEEVASAAVQFDTTLDTVL